MKHNDFEITGRVTFVNITYTDKGTPIVRTCVTKRSSKKEDEFMGLWIDMFGDVAESFAEKIVKGDSVNISGKIETDKFKTKDGKEIEKVVLKGWYFTKAMYDSEKKEFVPYVESSAPQKKETNKVIKDDSTPWG